MKDLIDVKGSFLVSTTSVFPGRRRGRIGLLAATLAAIGTMAASGANLLAPGQSIIGVAATPGSTTSAIASSGGSGNAYPAAESPNLAIDGNTATKYLNFAKINAGLIVTVPGGLSYMNGFQFTTANDAPERDPLTVTIEGTSAADPTSAAAGSTWTMLYNGPSGMPADPGRFTAATAINFANSGGFNTYRLLVTDVRNQAGANSFQFSEVQFFGTTAPDTNAPLIASVSPLPGNVGSLSSITVLFNEAVNGVEASDLLINGVPATNVTGTSASYTFSFPPLPFGPVQVTFANNPGIFDFGNPPNQFDRTATNATWNYTVTDLTAPTVTTILPIPGSLLGSLHEVEIIFSETVTNVDAGDLLINGVGATNVDAVAPGQFVFSFPQPPTGQVQVAWFGSHGIKDLYSNNFVGTQTWSYLLDPNAGAPVVLINEFMADNDKTLHDEDGDSSDWIELYNKSPFTVNLDGWYLTDSATTLKKWRLPAVSMPTNSYLIVYASGKNRTNATGRLHTNFQLNNSGEYLGLIFPDGTNVASEFAPTYPNPQRTDISYGRDPLQTDLTGYFSSPTPGARNIPGGAGVAPDVIFSRESGTFVDPFLLTLTPEIPGSNVVIRYLVFSNTTGLTATNVPGTNSPIYTSAIPITATMHVRARAFQTGSLPGRPQSQSYIALNTNSLNFTSDLPIVILHNVGGGTVPSSSDQFVMMQEFDPKNGVSSITNAPDLTARGIFHLRGSSTLSYPKGSFFFEAEDEFGDDRAIPFGGMPAESDWALYAPNNFEPVLIHNPTAYELSRQVGRYASRTRLVVVLLNTGGGAITLPASISGGNYNGIYVLTEKIKIDNDRIDIDRLQAEDNAPPAVTGGYLLSIDRVPAGEVQLNAGGQGMNHINPNYATMILPQRLPQRLYISNYFAQFGAAVGSASYTNPVTGYMPFVDAGSWIDHSILNVVTFNVDALRLSGYFHKPRNGGITMGPVWDFDRTQNSTDGRDANPRTFRSTAGDLGTDFFNPQSNGVQWWGRMFTDPNFFQLWVDRYQQLRTSQLANTNVAAIIDKFAGIVRQEQPREQSRWGVTPRYGGYTGEVAQMKIWYSNRLDFIDTNFLARPRMNTNGGMIQPGFQLVLTPPAEAGSSMYYTLDGTDPRALHGGIGANAQLYTGPITLSNNTRVTTRSYNPNHRNLTGPNNPPISVPWSGPKAETFVVHTPDLIVSELMYHPAPPASISDTNDADNFEYIELRNVGTNTLNLVGFKFTNGIDFTFTTNSLVTNLAPGDYVLVVKNSGSFVSRYGANSHVAGEYGGNFDNAGERVTLVGPALEPVIDFVYQDAWYGFSDGLGFSLVAVNDSVPTDLSTNTSWRLSSVDGGSPGAANPAAIVVTDIVIVNEALTHTDPAPPYDTIELLNVGTNDANISGWWLTDDFNTPKKFQIPNGTIVPAGGFVTFDETLFNAGGNGFALGSDGDELWVFSGTNGFITGYAQGTDFGAAQNGRSFGRYTNSQGAVHFVAQATNTLGAPNSLPFVGPVVISEIMYHPPEAGSGLNLEDNSLDEFIELYNFTSTNVPLYHPSYPANTWRLTSAVDFSFPTNVSIPPSNYVLVVSFDPATNGAVFRAKYGVPTNVPLYGPYVGKLDNSSESVRLRRPDSPNGPDVPYILVDQVDYSDTAPWPFQADGLGASLHRVVLPGYGNDVTNWVAARATPGAAIEGGDAPLIVQQPMNVTIVEGRTTNLTVVVSSPTAVSYQWQQNSNTVPGATAATLVFTNIQLSQAGVYRVGVFNGGGSVFSTSVVVSVVALPRITQPPTNQFVQPGTNVTLAVTVVGTGTIRYQWQFEETDITGATNSSYSFTNATLPTHHGNYRVFVTDDVGTVVSTNVFIYVMVKPGFLLNPVPVTVLAGGTARFTAIATGAPPIYYRWFRQGVALLTNTTGILTINNVQLPNGNIRVLATNQASGITGLAMTPSGGVALTVLPDADHDGISDLWETAFFGSTNTTNNVNNALEDPDGDGMNNRDEYIAGTIPTNAASYLKIERPVIIGGAEAVLQFEAVSNRNYTLDYRDVLGSGTWTNLFAVPSTTNNRTIRLTNTITAPTRLYRVTIPE